MKQSDGVIRRNEREQEGLRFSLLPALVSRRLFGTRRRGWERGHRGCLTFRELFDFYLHTRPLAVSLHS